jgi:amidohydrolase
MDTKAAARAAIERARTRLVELSHRIHAKPETGFEEEHAAGWLCEALGDAGYAVERGVAGLPTAFRATRGSGPLTIAICAEYDSLPGIGHACGHNVIGSSAVGAAIGLGAVADDVGLTVRIVGTPAEESGGGKVLLLERGAFEGAHAAMMVHPAPLDIAEPNMIAWSQFDIHYHGKEAHASAFPELGVNALDALTIAQTAIGLLRQHIRPGDRVHGIITHGGDAPNVVPAHTSARYMIRAETSAELGEIQAKVMRCFEAGAIATGTRLDVQSASPSYAEVKHDRELAAVYRRNAEELGRFFPDLGHLGKRSTGSTDMGNVSQALPSIHPTIGLGCYPVVNHQPEFAAYCATPVADQALYDGAVAMAWTAIDVAADGSLRDRLIGKTRS